MRDRLLTAAFVLAGILVGYAATGPRVEAQSGPSFPFHYGETVELDFVQGTRPPLFDPAGVPCVVSGTDTGFVRCKPETGLEVAYNLDFVTRVRLIKRIGQ